MKHIESVGLGYSIQNPIIGYQEELYNQITRKVESGEKLDRADIESVFEILLKSNTPVARSRAAEVIISILDPKGPSRPNKSSDAIAVLLELSSKPVQDKLRLQDSALPKIAYYLSHQGGNQKALELAHQRAAKALTAINTHHRLPPEINEQLQSYKDSLASTISLRQRVGSDSALKEAKRLSGYLNVLNGHETSIQSTHDALIERLGSATGLRHYNLTSLLVKKTKGNITEQGLINIARGLPYEDEEKTALVLKALKLIYARDRSAPEIVIDTLKEFGVIGSVQLREFSANEESKEAPQICIEEQGKTRNQLISELRQNNNDNIALLKKLERAEQQLATMDAAFDKDSGLYSQGKAIKNWQAKEIFNWSKSFKSSRLKARTTPYEMIAIAAQAVKLHKGYSPRDIQILSSILLISKADTAGRLLQIKTGEGKTVISAMTAAFLALQKQKPIDIITSSPVLAERDAKEQEDYFALFGLTCTHVTKGDASGAKPCYSADILYGYASDLEGDYLRDYFKGLNTRMGREFAYVIVDEVDSMLLDEGAKITKLSSPRPGVEYLAPIFLLSWQSLSGLEIDETILSDSKYFQQLHSQVEEQILKVIDSGYFTFPTYLLDYIYSQTKSWAKSAIIAAAMQEDKHYVISFDKERKEHVIAPVDYINSGVVQSKTNWEKGLHQFLQAKHKLRMQPEGLTTSFISNLSFFSMYGNNIMGMTGTLGSNESRSLLAEQYNLDTVIVPKFKDDLFHEEEAIIVGDSVSHKQAITDDAIAEANKGRAVLIICSDIGFTKACAESIVNAGYNSNKVNIYSRNDLDEESIVTKVRKPGDIIIATNLAGRGTDIRLEDQVNKAGGLYVILTSLPKNLRVEDQAFGRTAREGNPGSGRLIIDGVSTSKSLGIEYNPKNDISVYKKIRDFSEKERLSSIKEKELAQVAFSDKLFNKFNKQVYQLLKTHDQNRYLLEQLEESWGFWLKSQEGKIKTTSGRELIAKEFKSFKFEQIKTYRSGQPTNNPIYQIQMAHSRLGKDNSYDESIALLEQVVRPDDPFSFAGHYYLAYAYLRKNLAGKAKNDMNLSSNAFKHLSIAKAHLEDVIIAQLQAMQLILGTNSMGTPLGMQISNKIELLNHQLNYINNAIEFLEANIDGKRIITAGTTKTFDQFYPPDKAPKGEIEELNRLGSLNLYTIDAKNPPKDIFSSVVVTLVGIGQVVFGIMAALATGGVKGVGLIVGGLQDVYRGASAALKGEGIDLGDYFKAKAIEIGIDLISTGIANKMRGPSSVASQSIASQTVKLTTKEILTEVGIRVGTRLATEQVVKIAVKELSKSTFKKAIGGEIKQAIATIKERLGRPEIKNALENIYAIDSLYNSRYSSKLSSEINACLNKRSNELETIAASIISSTLSKATAGNGAASVVINTTSTGLQIASAIDKIQNIADEFCDHMEHAILEVAKGLPGNREIIKHMVPSLTEGESQVVEENLNSFGIFTGQWEIDEELLGFKQGIDEILTSSGYGSDIEVKSIVSGSDTGSSVIVPFEFEEIKKDTSKDQESKAKEVERRDLDKMRLAIGLDYKKYQIKEAVRKMHAALARRGELAEPVIESYSEIVASRMRGQIKSAIVSPVMAKPIGAAFALIEQSLVQTVVYDKYKLEHEFLQENYKRAGFTGIGIASGEGPEEKEPLEAEKLKKLKPESLGLELRPKEKLDDDLIFEEDDYIASKKKAKASQFDLSKPFVPYISGEYSFNSDKTVPIYDSSKKTSTGFSLINTAQAYSGTSIATTISGGIGRHSAARPGASSCA